MITLTLATTGSLPAAAAVRSPTAGRLRASLAYARASAAIQRLLGLQAVALLFFTISIPVEVVLAQHSLHAGAGGYGALLAAWGGGAVLGSLAYARWRGSTPRALISLGTGLLGLGFVVMAAAPSLAVAAIGAVAGGAGNGIESVAARTALQEQVQEQWMAFSTSRSPSRCLASGS